MDVQRPANSAEPVSLPWTFGFSKLLGVSALHTDTRNKVYGISLQIMSIIILCLWVRTSNVFVEKTLNGFVFGFVHTITTYNAVIYMVCSWRNKEKVVKAMSLLNTLTSDGICNCEIFLIVFTWSTLLTMIALDLLLDQKDLFILHLENFVYYFPLLQILIASNQFVVLVLTATHRLNVLLSKVEPNQSIEPKSIIHDYNTLYESCQLINETYSFPNLITIIRHGLACAFTSYYFVMAALNLFPPHIAKKKLWLSSCSVICFFAYIANIFRVCQITQTKAKKFEIAFYDRISSDPAHKELFLSRPIYKKIKFSAYNVFTINYKAFNGIVTTLITYQVILLQFALTNVSSETYQETS
ncbi:hypothetical protein GE061_015409 [Apolygus lucorum]|uniref:Gustatory receptor n=1 Tax=Apolygus lucorum TaxID=248454 RepID=A0A8S9XKW0_APOLU|nr:hypothetical protein GE061_015409 [Apolygus lucorum]